jgi:hypothetical protein
MASNARRYWSITQHCTRTCGRDTDGPEINPRNRLYDRTCRTIIRKRKIQKGLTFLKLLIGSDRAGPCKHDDRRNRQEGGS